MSYRQIPNQVTNQENWNSGKKNETFQNLLVASNRLNGVKRIVANIKKENWNKV